MAKNRKNNNPEGRNQYSGGWMDNAKDRPMATAAAAAAAVGAGVFLWSRRNQITDQISTLGDQISDWSQSMRSSDGEMAFAEEDSAFEGASSNRSQAKNRGSRKSGSPMSATGGGNASFRAHSGGGMNASSAGGGRAKSAPTS